MAEPLEQAPAWIRASAMPPAELAAMRAEALAEIAKWRRGEPSRVTTSKGAVGLAGCARRR
jgi:hypothetical protein